MNFSIATTVSNSYRPVADFCLPSWFKNSGAEQIDVRFIRGSDADTLCKRWYFNLIERCHSMRDFVRAAVRRRRPLILMDADCLILKGLSSGFCKDRPLSMARWPNINMGVVFLNTTVDWPFVEFFDTFVQRAEKECLVQKESGSYHNKGGDQDVMWEMVRQHGDDIRKLKQKEWNFAFSTRTTKQDLDRYKEAMRVLHIRIATYGCMTEAGCDLSSIQFLRDEFPDAFEESQCC